MIDNEIFINLSIVGKVRQNVMKSARNYFYNKNSNSKSVRKNCFWTEANGNKYLISYETIVCCIDTDNFFHKFWNDYSLTTLNQINCFIDLFYDVYDVKNGARLDGFNKKEWLEYITETPIYEDVQQIIPLLPQIEYNMYDRVVSIKYN